MVGAIILAGGASARMGRPKALLKIGEKTFIEHIAEVLHTAGVQKIAVVLGANANEIREHLPSFLETVVVNSNWETGMLSSILAGLAAFSSVEIDGAMFCPVDHPLIDSALLVKLLGAFRETGKRIIVPAYQGRRGHPVLFHSSLFRELSSAPGDVGARAVVRDHPGDVAEVPTPCKGVVINIDTPADYEKYCSPKIIRKDGRAS